MAIPRCAGAARTSSGATIPTRRSSCSTSSSRPASTVSAKALYERGIHHFGFWVDNVEDVATRARVADVPFVYGPADTDTATYGEPAGGTIRLLMLRDPDGNIVQLDQRVTS